MCLQVYIYIDIAYYMYMIYRLHVYDRFLPITTKSSSRVKSALTQNQEQRSQERDPEAGTVHMFLWFSYGFPMVFLLYQGWP